MIGDQLADVAFGRAIGCKSIRITSETEFDSQTDFNANTILNAARWIEFQMGGA